MKTTTTCATCGIVRDNTDGSPWNTTVAECNDCLSGTTEKFETARALWEVVEANRVLAEMGGDQDVRARGVMNYNAARAEFNAYIEPWTMGQLTRFMGFMENAKR